MTAGVLRCADSPFRSSSSKRHVETTQTNRRWPANGRRRKLKNQAEGKELGSNVLWLAPGLADSVRRAGVDRKSTSAKQCLDQRALGQGPIGAALDHFLENFLHRAQVGDLGPDVVEVSDCDVTGLGARLVALLSEA